jgi:formylglycine-generating enzyme required for sulfatase activity
VNETHSPTFSGKELETILGLPMVWIPPGPFLMGSDPTKDCLARDNELPQHEITLPGYWIGQHPVTEVGFQAFVKAGGYRESRYWREAEALGVLNWAQTVPGPGDVTDPDKPWRPGHYPQGGSWYAALAFTRWLAEQSGLPVTLPSEAEWEKAARGMDGRIYPWGDELPDPDRCFFGNEDILRMPVGRYSPQGDSPYGCADMAGNVWEWTRSVYGRWNRGRVRDLYAYPYDPTDGRENLRAGLNMLRVLRGGDGFSSAEAVRCACRFRAWPVKTDVSGFRVCVAPSHRSDGAPSRRSCRGLCPV